jgi:putative DNA primase/helicase
MTRIGGGLAEQKAKANGLPVPDSKVVSIDRVRRRGPSSDGDDPGRPVIKIEAGQLPRMVDEGNVALAAHTNIYQRSGELVTIVREPDRVDTTERDTRRGLEITLRPGTPRLRTVSLASLRVHLASVAEWRKYAPPKRKDEEGEWVPAHPDSAATAAILDPTAAGGWPDIRPIRGILESPALAPSGCLITTPGYNPETGYVLLPSVDVGKIEKPTQAEARAALKYLWCEIFCDFPYLGLGESDPTDFDRSKRFEQACKCPDAFVAISALLTMFARPAIEGSTPGSVFEAASQGSGKTLQIHAISTLATGRSAGLMTFPTHDGKVDESELEKILASYALAGARIIAFDNIKGTLGGAALEKAMTAVDSIDLRVLGSSETRTMPWSASTIFSGNNMAMSDDVAQRVLCSRLESDRDDPRSRPSKEFRHPRLLDWIREHRAKLVRACLVILRAFIVAESNAKPDAGSWGSFEAWSALVPAAILYAGGPNVLELRQRGGAVDNGEGAAHAALMRAWPTKVFPKGVRAVELLKYASFQEEKEIEAGKLPPDGLDDLRNALREITQTPDGRMPSSTTVGHALRALRGKWREGRKVVSAAPHRTGVATWQVENREQKPAPSVSDSTDSGVDPPTAARPEADPAEDFDR